MPGQASVQGRSPSLKARALRYLSQREHSRAELERKLAPHALPEDELRSLLDAFNEAKKTAGLTLVKMLVTGLVLALLAGTIVKIKLFGGPQ